MFEYHAGNVARRRAELDLSQAQHAKLADGVWYVGGIRHASVAVEFRDFVAVVEAPRNEKRAIAVIDEVHRLVSTKSIRYLVNTHHHFDHAGGLCTFVAEGAAIVTHQMNREFYEKVVFSPAPRTLAPDRLYVLNPDVLRDPVFELVNQKYVISDGTRTLDVYPVPAFDHASSMVFAYLPRERLAVNADMYTPPKQGARCRNRAPARGCCCRPFSGWGWMSPSMSGSTAASARTRTWSRSWGSQRPTSPDRVSFPATGEMS